MAYCTVREIDFKDYIKLQYTFSIDRKTNFEVEELMEVAANQYKMLVEGRTWKATEASDDQFVAVMAEKASLKKLNTTYKSKKTGNKSNGEESSSAPWKSIAPAEGLPQKKTVGSKNSFGAITTNIVDAMSHPHALKQKSDSRATY